MGDGYTFVGETGHFLLSAGIIERKADETFDGRDGVFVVGEGGGGGGFAHGAGGVIAHECAVVCN